MPCAKCPGETAHKVLTGIHSSDESPDGDIRAWSEALVIQCQGCKTISFLEEYACSEDWETDPDTGQTRIATSMTVYPPRIVGRAPLDGLYDVPEPVRRVYVETHKALCSGSRTLAAIGIRMIVESVCKAVHPPTSSKDKTLKLEERISALVPGTLTADGAELLHGLRFMGNDAGHDAVSPPDQELSSAFDVVESLLKNVYLLPAQAEAFRRKTRTRLATIAARKQHVIGKARKTT